MAKRQVWVVEGVRQSVESLSPGASARRAADKAIDALPVSRAEALAELRLARLVTVPTWVADALARAWEAEAR